MPDKKTNIAEICFPEAKNIMVSGDIHGNFNELVYKLCVQYKLTDTLLVVAGDCGFGFELQGYYENMVKRNDKRMSRANNWIVFIRGNHDNPTYFDGMTFKHRRFIAVTDYTILKACSHTILCIGGAISIDRQWRKEQWLKMQSENIYTHNNLFRQELGRNIYWQAEAPIYDSKKMDVISKEFTIDTVITHTAPAFCELHSKDGLKAWGKRDSALLADVSLERAIMDKIYNHLQQHNHPIKYWCYGHFHQSWHSSINGTLFIMLDIMEFYKLS